MSDYQSPLLLTSLLKEKCPKCRKGNIFLNKHIFPLKYCLKTVDYCATCGQKIKVENNYGQGMNFVFIFIIYFFNLFWYWPIVGLSFKDNSIYYYIAVSTVMVLVLQPWLMRFSRVLFLYLVIKFSKGVGK
jgi:uncharacterized protein (DUF983 family)